MISRARTVTFWGALCAVFALAMSASANGQTLYLDMSGMTANVGQDLYYRTIDTDADVLVEQDSIVLADADTVLAVGPIADGGNYRVDFFADVDASGSYDAPPADNAWRVSISATAGDDTIAFAHSTEYTDIMWPDEIEPNDVKADAPTIDLDSSYVGYIQTADDRDRWIVETPEEAGTISATVIVPAESGLRLYVAIKDSLDGSYLADATMTDDTLTVEYEVGDDHDGKFIVKVRYNGEDGHSATIPYTVSTSWDYTPRDLSVEFTGFEAHVGQLWKIRLVNVTTGEEVDRQSTILENDGSVLDDLDDGSLVFKAAKDVGDLSYEWSEILEVGDDYVIEYYADVNKNGRYNNPTTDNAWSDSITVEPEDVELVIARDDDYTKIAWDDQFTWVYGGLIPASTFWRASSSPFYLADTVTVKAGATLTIQPGVEVYAYYDTAAVVVNGRLLVQGTEAAPVNFSTYGDDDWSWTEEDDAKVAMSIGPSYWGGIDLMSSAASSIAWARIAHGNGELGGGLKVVGVELALDNVLIEDCYADDMGGGLYVEADAEITGGTVIVRSNAVNDSEGGGLAIINSSLALSNVTIVDNYVDGDGGAIYAESSDITLSTGVLNDNYASGGYGGGIYATDSHVILTDGEISDNEAWTCGAIAAGDGSVIELTNVDVRSNEAGPAGGITLNESELYFDGGTLVRNVGSYSTGLSAFYSYAELRGVEVSSRVTHLDCCPDVEELAGIAIIESDVQLTQCTVARNIVGIVMYDNESSLDINSSIVHSNLAAGILILDGRNPPGGNAADVTVAYSNVQEYIPAQSVDEAFYDGELNEQELLQILIDVIAEPLPQSLGVWPGVGNTDADPLFVAPEGRDRDFNLHFMSPAINTGDPMLPKDPDGTRADMGAYPISIRSAGLLAVDVPNDQGGEVYLKWWASKFDINVNDLTHYSIWRSSMLGLMGSPPAKVSKVGGVTIAWEWIADVPAHRLDAYGYTAPTLSDRTDDNNADLWFMVSAQTANPNVFHDSDPVMTYSVDNLAPAAPAARLAGSEKNTVTISWDPSRASINDSEIATDLRTYEVWRSDASVFSVDNADLLGLTYDTTFVDEAPVVGTLYYHVLAEDIHDNKSVAGTPVEVTFTNILGALPDEFALHNNAPNPFNPSTTIRFDLVDADHVRLAIYNTNGQLVRSLIERDMVAGRHEIVWNGLDNTGRAASSGVYIYRLESNQGIDTKRMTLVR